MPSPVMRTHLLAAVLAIGFLIPASEGVAQVDATAAVSALNVGQQVRIQAPGTVVELGTVSEIDERTLYVLEGGQEWLVEVGTIERLEVRRRSVIQYALILGAIGAGAGAAARKFRESISPTPFLVGGVVGGAALGFTQWRWQVTFPR